MIIEFIGAPSAGKSTILKTLKLHLQSMHLVKEGNIYRKSRLIQICNKILYAFQFSVLKPQEAFLTTIKIFKAHKIWLYAGRDILNVLYLNAKYLKAKKRPEIIYIFDQGLVQAELSIKVHGNSLKKEKLLLFLNKSENVFILNLDLNENYKRLKNRNSKKSRTEKGEKYHSIKIWQEEIMKILNSLSSSKVNANHLDASKSVEINAFLIIKIIKQKFKKSQNL